MSFSTYILYLAALLLTPCLARSATHPVTPAKPNFIFILTDDQP